MCCHGMKERNGAIYIASANLVDVILSSYIHIINHWYLYVCMYVGAAATGYIYIDSYTSFY